MNSYANRGLALEDLAILANKQYRQQGIAVIEKIPSSWLPIRNGQGKIVTAKIEARAPVDFIGRYQNMPIAFDAKSVSKGNRWYWSKLPMHQYEFLRDWEAGQARSFILLGFWQQEEFFFLPFWFIKEGYEKHLARTGPASLLLQDLERLFPVIRPSEKGIVLDYLASIGHCRAIENVNKGGG